MSPFFAVFLVLLLGSSSYAAGRLHGQLSYRIGYRFGYRQGYFDGDRGAWNRRRRDAQVAISALAAPSVTTPDNPSPMEGNAVLANVAVGAGVPGHADGSDPASVPNPVGVRNPAAISQVMGMANVPTAPVLGVGTGQGTTYMGASFVRTASNAGRHSTDTLAGGNG